MVKISKAAADYEPVAKGKDQCRHCKHFEVLAPRHCEAVHGIIAPGAWCRLFSAIKSRMAGAFRKAK